jgi:hypothetical protein
VIDRLLDRVRGGQSESLGVRGEAGIGKTALLDYARGADSESTPATRRMVMSPGRDPVPDTIALTPRLLALFRERIERLPAAT